MSRSHFPSTLMIVMALLVVPAVAFALSPSKVTLNFMCPCGSCDEALSTCECPSSDGYRAQIAGMVGRGYSEEQIIENFKGQFGPQVLIANAALAPNASGRTFDKRTFGFILLLASFSLAAFGLGKYMNSAPAPVKGKTINRPKTAARRQSKPAKRNKSKKEFTEGIDDELLDDYDYE